MKRKLLLSTLITLGLSLTLLIIIGLIAVFSKSEIPTVMWRLTGTFATLFALSLLALNFSEALEKKNVLAIISICMLSLSALVLLILIWKSSVIQSGDSRKFKVALCWSIFITAMYVTLLFNPILKLQKRFKKMQIVTFVLLTIGYIQFMMLATMSGVEFVDKFFDTPVPFITLYIPCVAIAGLEIVANIFKNKDEFAKKEEVSENDDNMITISKDEYNKLLSRISELEKENESLKNN